MTRIVTYNVHRCVGVDRKLDVARIAAVIAECEPDIVCLQELDVGRARTGGVDQAHAIAELLDMSFHFNPAMQVEEELYGDAVLTALPERRKRIGALPTVSGIPGLEPRGALWIEVQIDGRPVQILNTHLGLVPHEQRLQARALLGKDWLGHTDCTGPTVLVGDFNCTSLTRPYKALAGRLKDAQRCLDLPRSIKTFPSAFPTLRIDHCFVSPEIRIRRVAAPFHPLARMASDHLPLVIDFEVEPVASANAA